MKRVHIILSGRVQGIYFRYFIKNKATKLNLKGFVRNTEDKVEALFEGEENNIKKILEYCKKGPLLAKVTETKIKEEKHKGEFKDFSIIY